MKLELIKHENLESSYMKMTIKITTRSWFFRKSEEEIDVVGWCTGWSVVYPDCVKPISNAFVLLKIVELWRSAKETDRFNKLRNAK